MKILLVDDDELLGQALSKALLSDRYLVNVAIDGQTALDMTQTFEYDLILLDVQLPKIDGISVCRQLRAKGFQNPILLLTAKDSKTDKIIGLDAGADDYMTKPFDVPELMARVRALLRRKGRSFAEALSWGDIQLYPETGEVHYQEKILSLTPKEFRLLEMFLKHPQRVFSRSSIIDQIWGLDEYPTDNAVTTHIKDLRQRLKAGGVEVDPIETVYGLGYRLKAPPDDLPAVAPVDQKTRSQAKKPPKTTNIEKLLKQYQNSFDTQLSLLEQAQAQLLAGRLDQDLRQQATREAHKLAGSLGIFGFPTGSTIARQIEQWFLEETTHDQTTVPQLVQLLIALKLEVAKPPQIEGLEPTPSSTQTSDLQVLLVSSDRSFANLLQPEFQRSNIQVQSIDSLEETGLAIAQNSLNAVLLDLTSPALRQQGLSVLTEISTEYADLPVLVFTSENNLAERVQISRCGGRGILSKAMSPNQILKSVAQVLPQDEAIAARVMVVDDDPNILAMIEALLQPWGLQVITLENPQHFWEVLTAQNPDLLVLDIEMPTFDGFDLCQVVRQDPEWGNLPILIFTAHTDVATVQRVFAIGADDFVGKPVVGPELVTRIISRIERLQLQRKLQTMEQRLRERQT